MIYILEETIEDFKDIIEELDCYKDELSYYEIYHLAVLIQKNSIEYKKLYLEEKKLEAFKQAHAIHPDVPSALEAIAMCLGMKGKGESSSNISDILSGIADSLNKD